MRQPVTRKDVFATGERTRHPMTSPSDEVFPGAAAWAEVAELNQRLYDARKQIQTLTEERDEARGLHEMSADSVVKLRHELVEAQANEAVQIAKGLQLAAQLDEARALLQEAKAELGSSMEEQQLHLRIGAFLQPSNEEGPQPLRSNPTVKSI